MVLTWIDYAVIVAYLVAITAFGSWFARFQKTTRDYFLTDRSVPWWAICFTIVATETSTLSFIGVPAGAYAGNMTFLQLAVGYIVGRLLVSVLFIPAYFRGELYTSYELLLRRFGPQVKNVAAIIFMVTRTLADGIRLFATALVISVVTQVPVSWTVVVLGVAMIVYTVRGGVSAVIWTDVVQMFVYVGGALVVFFGLLQLIPGGWSEVVRTAGGAGHFRVFDFSLNPTRVYTFWAGLLGGLALTLATHGTDQYLVQRLLSARSSRDASTGLVLSGFIVFAQFALFLAIGAMLFTYYQHASLPRPLVTNDEVLPLFVVSALPHGVSGFIVAAIVAAALSPSINALAATTVNDFYVKYVNPAADQATLLRLSKNATIMWGIAQIAVALGAQFVTKSVLDSGLAVLSLAAGPVLGAFLTGVLTTRVGSRAMLTGILTGIVTMFVVWWTSACAWTWYALVGASVTSLSALAASAVMPRTSDG
ncbi:MAG TPA: sodium:solute symporter [Vicinamibacterales bacterium]|jgi:SSS family solute:Na+ symporter|nr:sodium:solute symporter [Vicinamibacterales bacterium]